MQRDLGLEAGTVESLLDAMDGVAYVIDSGGLICAVGRTRWKEFAIENDAPDLGDATDIVGRPLLDFIEGDDVRSSYRSFLETLKSRRRASVSFEFSCDAPQANRRMRMSITPIRMQDRQLGLLFQSLLLEEHFRPPVDLFDPAVIKAELDAARELPFLKMCSYCQSVALPEEAAETEWISAETYYRKGGSSRVRISHGICPVCMSERVEPLIG